MYKNDNNLPVYIIISIIIIISVIFLYMQENFTEINNDNKFKTFFYNIPKKNIIHKWSHYFDIYDKHLKKFIGQNPTILEIGVYKGGSLDMWNYYFDNKCTIYGIDIDEKCKKFENNNIKIFIGDQSDPIFWDTFFNQNDIYFDIIIEDGGHTMEQQIVTYEKLFDRIKNNGVYLCEDLHTSYWPEYGGGYLNKNSFIEYSKNFIDMINAYHIQNNPLSLNFRKNIFCISYYDSIIVLDKKIDNDVPQSIEQS